MIYLQNLRPDEYVVRESLYIPKSSGLSEAPLRAGLTFQYVDDYREILISHLHITDTHYIIPRYYPLPKKIFDKLKDMRPPFPILKQGLPDTIELWEDQQAAYRALVTSTHGVVIMPCGSGKTVVALKAIAKFSTPTLIIVNTTHLLQQWIDRAKEFLGISEDLIGVIRGEVWDWRKPLVIGMLQTISKHRESISEEIRSWFGAVFWDEVDEMATPVYSRTADIFYGKRFGLSATKERSDGMHRIYYYHIGTPIYESYEQPLIPRVFFVELPPTSSDLSMEENYARMITALSQDPARDAFIRRILDFLLEKGRKILVLGERKEQLYRFHRQYQNSGLCVQEVDQEERIRQLQNCQIIFAIRRLAKRGLDQPDLDTLVMLTPLSDRSNVQQVVGRVLREHSGKQHPLVVVLVDPGVRQIYYVAAKMRRVLKELGYFSERGGYHEFFGEIE